MAKVDDERAEVEEDRTEVEENMAKVDEERAEGEENMAKVDEERAEVEEERTEGKENMAYTRTSFPLVTFYRLLFSDSIDLSTAVDHFYLWQHPTLTNFCREAVTQPR